MKNTTGKTKGFANNAAMFMFVFSVALAIYVCGMIAEKHHRYPARCLSLANEALNYFRVMTGNAFPFYYRCARDPTQPPVRNSERSYEGINLVTGVKADHRLFAKIVDMDGRTLHEWSIDWFEMWPDAEHLPERFVPRWAPGTNVHGAAVMDNGDLVFNFIHLGLVRVDRAGKIVWRLPYQTHHSVHLHDDGNLWVSGQKEHERPSERFPNRVPPFEEYTILVVSPEGEILRQWSVAELLRKNGLEGLLYLGSLDNTSTQVRGDVLHMNDVEPFPETMREGFFKKGDVAVSLRNINTVFVFDSRTDKIKFIAAGRFIRQHDPDFIDGERISVFDNNNAAPEEQGPQSRIVILNAPDDTLEVYYEGTEEHPFYTDILGKHQWLPNGNLLITESKQGRAFEIDNHGEIVWEYMNYVGEGVVGMIEEVQRLPPEYARFYK
ncbi:MAG: aryl-sulfate sulfotransferase [Pirellulales bacterium]|nr:aryl-sulfate sulfotransferase [Pirellulales bacterium]